MKRYFFDIRDGDELSPDEVGVELPDIKAVKAEAARSLADISRTDSFGHPFRHMAIEVRDDDGPVLEATFHWKLRLIKERGPGRGFEMGRDGAVQTFSYPARPNRQAPYLRTAW